MNFLIVKTSSIGDIIQTFPVVEYLKSKHPACQIDWIVEEEYASLVKSHPGISQVLTVGSRRWRKNLFRRKSYQELKELIAALKKTKYDVIFDLQGNTKSAFLTQVACGARKVGFGWNSSPEWPNYFVTRERFEVLPELPIQMRYLSVVQQFFKDEEPFSMKGVQLQLTPQEQQDLKHYKREGQTCIMVAFASKWENKCLSLSTLIQFLKKIHAQENCFFYFVSGSDAEKKIADELSSLFPESLALQGLSFPLWQRLMGQMDLVISVDSAALALCGTTSAPSFSFFGPTQGSVYKPLGNQHHHYQGSCPYKETFSARCPQLRTCKTGACLKDVGSQALFDRYSESYQKQS
ncbi:MAG: hypothetical protein KBA81_05225 [Rhabdochlamydiaceae bacterium]|nr:hypothetical protein [Rhabdochlamydiaceae bacterium]